jgi:hypothetical protein
VIASYNEVVIASYNEDVSAYVAFWVVFHVLLQVIAIISIARHRHIMEARLVVKWTLLVVFLPVVGLLGYCFHRMEEALNRNRTGRGRQDNVAPFLHSPFHPGR